MLVPATLDPLDGVAQALPPNAGTGATLEVGLDHTFCEAKSPGWVLMCLGR